MQQSKYENASPSELIWRWKKEETIDQMQQLSAEAEEVIGLFGVTAFSGKLPFNAKVMYASVNELIKSGFAVYITPLDSTPEHRTVVFPKPVEEKTMDLWRTLWKEKPYDDIH